MNFKEKVCWVTGASSGIGKALCVQLAREGAKVILSSRNHADLESLRLELDNAEQHSVLAFDLTDMNAIQAVTKEAWAINNRVDILFNNGGISQRSLALDTSLEVDRKIMEVDYFGQIALTKALLPKMIQRKQGVIINISSVAGKLGVSMRTAYSAAKHALIGFMDCLRGEVASDGIKVINVCPGFVKTNLSRNALKGNMAQYGKMDEEISNGMPVESFVKTLFKQLGKNKPEIIIANGMPKLGYLARRFFPNTFLRFAHKLYKRRD